MKIKGWRRVKRWGKKMWHRSQPHALILMYHRITDTDSDPQLLSVSPHNFDEQLQIVSSFYKPLRLRELVEQLSLGKVPHQAVAITFDDGYADNLHEARPILERYDIPATVFVTAGAVGKNQEFWWDDLERLLLKPGILPERLSLEINGSSYSWELGNCSHYSEAEYESHRNWHVLMKSDPTPRQKMYRSLCQLMRPLPTENRQDLLQKIAAWAQKDTIGRSSHRTLTPGEVQEIAKGGLIEVGAHTMTHPVLSTISKAGQQTEIRQSKERLDSILGLENPVSNFAYPYGNESDYTLETAATVREVGFASACSTINDVVCQGTDLFQLPRFTIRNWSGTKFASRLKG